MFHKLTPLYFDPGPFHKDPVPTDFSKSRILLLRRCIPVVVLQSSSFVSLISRGAKYFTSLRYVTLVDIDIIKPYPFILISSKPNVSVKQNTHTPLSQVAKACIS